MFILIDPIDWTRISYSAVSVFSCTAVEGTEAIYGLGNQSKLTLSLLLVLHGYFSYLPALRLVLILVVHIMAAPLASCDSVFAIIIN